MNRNENDFSYLKEKFPRISKAKKKEGLKIRYIMNDSIFDDMLNKIEREWIAFKSVVNNLLGNHMVDN